MSPRSHGHVARFWFVLLLIVTAACAPTSGSAGGHRLFDAPYDGPIETLALVLDSRTRFVSDTEAAMTDVALAALVGHPYTFRRFDVVERSRVDAITSEAGLARSGLVDLSTAARLGDLLAAKYIVLMSVSGVSVSPYTLGVSRGTGLSVYSVRASIQLRMVDVATSRVIAAIQSPVQRVVPGSFAVRGVGFSGRPDEAALLNAVADGAQAAVDDLMRAIGTP
jgi:curli biogenesis system outer membrane secretion channel CsgG